MVQSQLSRALLSIVLASTAASSQAFSFPLALPQDEKKPEPLNPFRLKTEEFKAGNPLAQFAEMVRMEKEFVADDRIRSSYWQARGTVAGFLGDNLEADRDWNTAYASFWGGGVLIDSPLANFHPESAVDVIVKAADKHNWIMLGEEHLKPQTRTILVPLVRALAKKGFRTLAVETFNNEGPDLAAKDGYPSYNTGFYTADPVFAAGIREAIKLGFKLVPYEETGRPKEPAPAGDTEYFQNFREHGQAKNLKERIFDKDPKAKVIVWAGRAHVLERSDKDPSGSVWTPMAYEFKRMTGVDPFSVYLGTYTEQSERRFERSLYKWATDRGLVKRPTIFVGPKGELFRDDFDAEVFFPRTVITHGRPDWLVRDMDRKLVPIPTDLVKKSGLQLAQVFEVGEPVTAIPVDQTLIRPGDPLPSLALPRGRFWMRVIDPEGKESGRHNLMVR